jgi:RNA polymerase sigma-70 factor (ECF subfamily)
MYRIAQNIWLDKGRAKRTRGEQIDVDSLHDLAGSDGRRVTETRLTLQAVMEQMRRLTKDQRVLIALVCVEGLSYKEAAEVLQLPIGTVMSRLARARQTLGAALIESEPVIAGATPRRERPRA